VVKRYAARPVTTGSILTWAGKPDSGSRSVPVAWKTSPHVRPASSRTASRRTGSFPAAARRPRKTLGWRTPAEALDQQLLLIEDTGVTRTG
jgi:hypothetical protein